MRNRKRPYQQITYAHFSVQIQNLVRHIFRALYAAERGSVGHNRNSIPARSAHSASDVIAVLMRDKYRRKVRRVDVDRQKHRRQLANSDASIYKNRSLAVCYKD
jgi:hypothetical protein